MRVHDLEPFGVRIAADHPGHRVDDLDVDTLRRLARTRHLVLLRGFSGFAGPAELADWCARWGALSQWPFGTVLELTERPDPEDHIFDHGPVPLHWDGMYREQVPEFQIFHCVQAPPRQHGGQTTFVDTTAVLRRTGAETVALWSRMTGVYRRKMEYYDSATLSPVVAAHPDHGAPVIRYNEPVAPEDTGFINRPELGFCGLAPAELAAAQDSLTAALHDPAHRYVHDWRAGDVLIADNYTLLHGRNAFASGTTRHLRRVHVLGDPPLTNPGLIR